MRIKLALTAALLTAGVAFTAPAQADQLVRTQIGTGTNVGVVAGTNANGVAVGAQGTTPRRTLPAQVLLTPNGGSKATVVAPVRSTTVPATANNSVITVKGAGTP